MASSAARDISPKRQAKAAPRLAASRAPSPSPASSNNDMAARASCRTSRVCHWPERTLVRHINRRARCQGSSTAVRATSMSRRHSARSSSDAAVSARWYSASRSARPSVAALTSALSALGRCQVEQLSLACLHLGPSSTRPVLIWAFSSSRSPFPGTASPVLGHFQLTGHVCSSGGPSPWRQPSSRPRRCSPPAGPRGGRPLASPRGSPSSLLPPRQEVPPGGPRRGPAG